MLLLAALLATPRGASALGERSAGRRAVQSTTSGAAASATAPARPIKAPKTPVEAKSRVARAKATDLRAAATTACGLSEKCRVEAESAEGEATTAASHARRATTAAATANTTHERQKAIVRSLTATVKAALGEVETAKAESIAAVEAMTQAPAKAKPTAKKGAAKGEGAVAAVAETAKDDMDPEASADAVALATSKLTSATRKLSRVQGQLKAARTQRTDTLAALRAANETAETLIAASTAARAGADAATSLAARMAADHAQADALASAAEGEADDLETRAEAANLRYDQKYAARDQHLFRLTSPALRDRHRAATRRWRAASFVTSKPNKVSQDSVATDPEDGLFAISDGVTNSDFSSELSRALVRRFTTRPPLHVKDVPTWLEGAQADWRAEVDEQIAEVATSWFNRGKKWRGDAAFVGARIIRDRGQRRMHLIGIGDTVAFLVRGGAIKEAFPLEEADEFSSTVKTLSSAGKPEFKVRQRMWDVKAGDEVFMATDALGHWILTEVERGRDPFPLLRNIKTRAEMDAFVVAARAGQVKYRAPLGGGTQDRAVLDVDDTTLMRFVVPLDEAKTGIAARR